MKNRLRLAFFSLLFAAILSLPIFIHAQQGTTQSPVASGTSQSARSARTRKSEDSARVEQDFAEALTIIQDNYVESDKLDYNTIFKSSINGMLHTLDPHSSYLDRDEFNEYRTDQRSEYFGIGATVGDLTDGETVDTAIRATFENSPAARAGLRYGDRIMEINGQSMRGKHYWEVREFLRGPRGSVVKLMVERAATKQQETVEITRDAVPQPSVPEAYMLRPGVGYIALTGGFNLTTGDEFEAALRSLRAKGMNSLVLDLRGNPGGLVNQAVRVAQQFLQRDQLILTQKGRVRGSSMTTVAESDLPDTSPLVVLVNRGTASASEIVVGALQDHDRALVVGETSFGKGLVQIPIPLDTGGALILTIAKYYTPSGRLIQRDYTSGDLYSYYSRAGAQDADGNQTAPAGPETRTDTGRTIYGGGGITPDETVKPQVVTTAQRRTMDPLFAFARELVAGRVAGFDAFKVQHPIEFGYDLKTTDFVVTDALYQAARNFIATNRAYKITGAQLDRQRAFVERELRYELATAAYGTTTAAQVYNDSDPQITKAVDLMPRARELAQTARLKRNPS